MSLSAEQQKVIYKALFEFGMVIWTEVGKDLAISFLKGISDSVKKGGALNKVVGSTINAFAMTDDAKELNVLKYRIIDDICEPLKDTDGDNIPDIKDKCDNDPECQ